VDLSPPYVADGPGHERCHLETDWREGQDSRFLPARATTTTDRPEIIHENVGWDQAQTTVNENTVGQYSVL
jgi:hypothetical protein